ncbi:MAG: ATP-binding cassette domain-containing protein [Rhodanobacter sp.]|nr:MAG: ATP-binding cassette domain-containing protein [Rhodanobacter sp.]
MLVIDGVGKSYADGIQVLDDIRLEMAPGIFGLLGPNGAGKSTLMKVIVGLLAPDSGRATFNGIDVTKDPYTVRKWLGYLPQDFGVYPDATARELLEHLAVLKGLRDVRHRSKAVDRLLEETNLTPMKHRKLGTYSGGMLQRFGIAQALLGDPKLIVVDEPTAGLDPEERYRLLNLLAGLRQKSVILLSTHLVQDVEALCSRMAILAQGKILSEDNPADALAKLRGRLYRTHIEPEELVAFRSKYQVVSSRLVEGALSLHFLSNNDEGLQTFERAEPTLEDFYFFELDTARAALAAKAK